jgi:TM2 domain-containing membrane protein YozV
MFCENCGKEMPDDATFCPHCGNKNGENIKKTSSQLSVTQNKNMITALIISFILMGLGIFYAGNKKKGLIIFIVGLIFNILGIGIPICAAIGLLIWVYGLYETYNEVKRANGVDNPNLINDIKGFPSSKKIVSIIIIAVIFLILVGGLISAFTPKHVDTNDYTTDDMDDDLYVDDSPSSSSSSSAGSGESYSSSSSPSSDGYDTHSHYEDEHGSADTYGTVHDDGSVDSYQTGHTDYGDYQIDSHMDSDGNIHGTVDMGGKTYHVST